MTLTERIRYLTDGLEAGAPGLSLAELQERLPDVPAARLKRTTRTMINNQQLVVRSDAERVYRMFSGPKSIRVIRTDPEKDAEREAREKYNNGNQQLVLEAIQRGNALVGDIAHATGLEEMTVRNHIRRLMQAVKVEREASDGLARYVPTKRICLLARVWTGFPRQPVEASHFQA